MTATQLRDRRYLKQTRSTLAIAAFFREYPQFNDCEFTFTGRSVTIFANEPSADLADICEIAGFDLVVDPTLKSDSPDLSRARLQSNCSGAAKALPEHTTAARTGSG